MNQDTQIPDMKTFEWNLAALLRPKEHAYEANHALIVLNHPVKNTTILRELWRSSCLRVAADGGANRLYELSTEGVTPGHTAPFDNLDVVIGDLDSLRDTTRSYFTATHPPTRIIHDADQETTDFGKAITWIRDQRKPSSPPVDIAAVGGIGGRVDQGLSQLHHLFLFQRGEGYEEGRMYLVSEESVTVLLKPGKHVIHVRGEKGGEDGEGEVFGKYVGIIPVKEPSVITTRGLEWDVTDWETSFGGRMSTSNHVLPETRSVEVETTKEVLFTISLK